MKYKSCIRDFALTLLILAVSSAAMIFLQKAFDIRALAPMVFVMAGFADGARLSVRDRRVAGRRACRQFRLYFSVF